VYSRPRAAVETLDLPGVGLVTDATAGTFVVAVILAVAGGLCAFFLRSHVEAVAAGETGGATALEPESGLGRRDAAAAEAESA
jgi:hypothetical protein